MWQILYHRQAVKRIKKLPPQIREKLDVWVEVASHEGPNGLKAFTGFNDEALSGDWKGFRSSRLSQQYRVIYSSDKDVLRILVVDVTAHDYKRS
jgi:addiction module RelE/StbE family toxin